MTPSPPPSTPATRKATAQPRLTIDYLEFLRTRLYDIHARHRYELACQMQVARALLADAASLGPDVGDRLADALSVAETTYATAGSHTDDLRAASQQLWASVRGVVRSARTAPEEVRDRIGEQVLAGIAPLVELESAWYVPFGFELHQQPVAPSGIRPASRSRVCSMIFRVASSSSVKSFTARTRRPRRRPVTASQ